MSHHGIEYEASYEAGTKRNILANARKGFQRHSAKQQFLFNVIWFGGYVDGQVTITKVPRFVSGMRESLEKWGKLSPKQVETCFVVLADRKEASAKVQARYAEQLAAQQANSKFIGIAGDKLTRDLTCKKIMEVQGSSFSRYDSGKQNFIILEDDDGNQFRYTGRSEFIEEGQKATVSFTVKKHYIDSRDVSVTRISHPKTSFVFLPKE